MRSDSKRAIQEAFHHRVKPQLASLEAERKLLWKKLLWINGTVASICSFFLLEYMLENGKAALMVAVVTGLTNRYFIHQYALRFKRSAIQELFRSMIANCTYQPQAGISEGSFRTSKLCHTSFNEFSGEDYVCGDIDGLPIEFSEVKAEYVTKDSKGGTSRSVVYRGLLFSFKHKEELAHETLILDDLAENVLGSSLGRKLQAKTRSGMQLVQLESSEFEREFAVYSTDQIGARVLLNPKTIQRIVEFKKTYKDEIEISVTRQKVFVSVVTRKNFFEPKLFGAVISMAEVLEIHHLLTIVTAVEESLDLEVQKKAG